MTAVNGEPLRRTQPEDRPATTAGKACGKESRVQLRLGDLLPARRRDAYSFTVADRDEAGFRVLSELTSRGVSDTADSVAQPPTTSAASSSSSAPSSPSTSAV